MATNDTTEGTGAYRADGTSGANVADDSAAGMSPEAADLQADIERTRADLADTVDQLTAKLDVKSRVHDTIANTKDNAALQLRRLQDQATDERGKPTPATLGISGAAFAAVVAVLVIALWRRNNTSRPKRWR
jgi:hypothetical protein